LSNLPQYRRQLLFMPRRTGLCGFLLAACVAAGAADATNTTVAPLPLPVGEAVHEIVEALLCADHSPASIQNLSHGKLSNCSFAVDVCKMEAAEHDIHTECLRSIARHVCRKSCGLCADNDVAGALQPISAVHTYLQGWKDGRLAGWLAAKELLQNMVHQMGNDGHATNQMTLHYYPPHVGDIHLDHHDHSHDEPLDVENPTLIQSVMQTLSDGAHYVTGYPACECASYHMFAPVYGIICVEGGRHQCTHAGSTGICPNTHPTKCNNPVPANTEVFTLRPTAAPTAAPTANPTDAPTMPPTAAPTAAPTHRPTLPPTEAPTAAPTEAPCEDSIHWSSSYGSCSSYALGQPNAAHCTDTDASHVTTANSACPKACRQC
jgi:hypothetical protein